MNKIISNFYLIRLDGVPVYVGYTNRTIDKRFTEHKREKDFGDIEPTVEDLGSLEYNFTWDEEIINQYAKEVSDRETELIEAYGTQRSIWQKGTSGNLGGQTWTNVKNFIRTNRNNPKFRGLPEESILALIEYQRKMTIYLRSVIYGTKPPEDIRLRAIIRHTKPPEEARLKSVISNTKPLEAIRLKNVINGTKPPEGIRLKSVINNTKSSEDMRLKNVIRHTNPPEQTRLKSVIAGTRPIEETRLKNVITNTKPLEETRLKSAISSTKPLEYTRLKGVINNTKPLEEARLTNVISGTKPPEYTRLKNVIKNTNSQVANKKNL